MDPDPPRPSASAFGRFPSLGAFLDHDRVVERRETLAFLASRSLEQRAAYLAQPRHLAEVHATVLHREPDDQDAQGGLHDRFTARILSVLQADPNDLADVQDCVTSGRAVFVAVRTGDAMGIQVPILGLTDGAAVHLKGEWITRDRAQAHGGARMSVLHFTHHPVGFLCTPVDCYS